MQANRANRNRVHTDTSPRPRWRFALALAGLVTSVGVWTWQQQAAAPAPQSQPGQAFPWTTGGATEGINPPSANEAAGLHLSAEQADAQQREAASAVLTQVGQRPLAGPVADRPAFVSRLEWLALRHVAGMRPDSAQELTRLINQLRFLKLVEAWKGLPAAAPEARPLAEQLLQELPDHVVRQEIGLAEARSLQASWIAAVAAGDEARRQRAAAEAARLPSGS